jgi:uncharacterized protein YxjI
VARRLHDSHKVFSFGNKLSFNDREGRQVAAIAQKLLSIGPQYEIERDGKTAAIARQFGLLCNDAAARHSVIVGVEAAFVFTWRSEWRDLSRSLP